MQNQNSLVLKESFDSMSGANLVCWINGKPATRREYVEAKSSGKVIEQWNQRECGRTVAMTVVEPISAK